jgi:hypothetical protein
VFKKYLGLASEIGKAVMLVLLMEKFYEMGFEMGSGGII